MPDKLKIAVHKFSSCDGCQLAFLNHVRELMPLLNKIEIAHFAEAGPCDPDAEVDIAFVEGSIATPHDIERIQRVRLHCKKLVSIGACATSGGIQALRNIADHDGWRQAIYAQPQCISTLASSSAIAEHVRVDHELWGCPLDAPQLLRALQAWLNGHEPEQVFDSVCSECKAHQTVCVMVAQNRACMGPVTRKGCGALCPTHQRGCYGCYGPAQLTNAASLAKQFTQQGMPPAQIARQFLGINSHAKSFNSVGTIYLNKDNH
jgi:coenzyme F420-reducing hydrogenase gamma subunit